MQLLTTIYRTEKEKLEGRIFFREAVRGIVLRGNPAQLTPQSELLMIHSKVRGDFKFPGGGREPDEPYIETLRRELCEEAGASLKNLYGEFGKVLEYGNAKEADFEIFKMVSFYYLCAVDEKLGTQKLEGYEERLGLVSLHEAYGFVGQAVRQILTFSARSNTGDTIGVPVCRGPAV